ncbi:Pupal cuticle protein C1 [Nesidiocoris tenuis]|uniref:Pupal cuticle protein C1 n=1 Tax=Nesidiocoris tenuis TaxID=355587 RepID=A0ABN7BBM0_9HEMI|nr:Pupal cuticle protein C1 [Nesidiocoris tenuis]
MYKILILSAFVAYAQAGLLAAPAAITSQQQNILRSWGNLGQVSTYSKTIDTPWSSVSKSDIRVSNPGLSAVAAPALIAQRAIAAPALISAPRAIAAPTLIGTAYSAAPAVSHVAVALSGLEYGW